MSTAVISIVYAGIWGVSAFQDISNDKYISHTIGTFDIIIGALYMGLLILELFGLFAAFKQSAPLVRIYSLLGVAGILCVMTAEMLRVIIHFKYKHQIIDTCITDVTTTDDAICNGPFCSHGPLSQKDGKDWCNSHYNRDSFGDIAWFLVASFFSGLFNVFSWGYLHQLLAVGTRVATGPGVYGAEGPGVGHRYGDSDSIGLETYPAGNRFAPPAYPPPSNGPGGPRESTDSATGLGADVPKYDGYNAGDYLSRDEKAPGYEFGNDSKKMRDEDDDEDDEDDLGRHGPRVSENTNPFR